MRRTSTSLGAEDHSAIARCSFIRPIGRCSVRSVIKNGPDNFVGPSADEEDEEDKSPAETAAQRDRTENARKAANARWSMDKA